MAQQPQAPQIKHQLITVYSGDRDKSRYADTNLYELDIPTVHRCVGLKLASFEMQTIPQYTVRTGVNDELYFDQGQITGGMLTTVADGSQVYENEIRIDMIDSSTNATALQFYLPPHDLQASLIHEGTSGGLLVYCDGAHGLYNPYNNNAYEGPDVWMLCSNQGEFLLANASGLQNNVVPLNATNLFIPTASIVTDAADDTVEGAMIHTRPWAVDDVVTMINSKGANMTTQQAKFSTEFSSGQYNFTLQHNNVLTSVKMQYSDQANWRGVGHALGYPNRGFREINGLVSGRKWVTKARTQPKHFVARLPNGLHDAGDVGTHLSERINAVNLATTRAYDQNGLQLGVRTHLGEMFAVRIPVGHWSALGLGTYLMYQLNATVTPTVTWTFAYDRTTRKWTITNGGGNRFALVFSYTAEPGTTWATSAGVPSTGAASMTHMARLLGFVPNTIVHSNHLGVIESVEAASIMDEIEYPRFDNTNDSIITQDTPTGLYRWPQFSTIVATREPHTHKIGFGGRNPHILNASIDDSSNSTMDWVVDNTDTQTLTAIGFSPTGYTTVPSIPYQVGQFVNVGNTSTDLSLVGQVIGLDASASAGVLRVDTSGWAAVLNGSGLPITTITMQPFDEPAMSIYRSSTVGERIGLTDDLELVEHFTEVGAMWNTEHHPEILLQVTPAGHDPHTVDSFLSQKNSVVTPAFARIPVRHSGLTHINSLGTHEHHYDVPHNVGRIKIALENADGTPYETNKVEHTIGLIAAFR